MIEKNELKICELSAVGEKNSEAALGFVGERKTRVLEMLKGLEKDNFSAISIREVSYKFLKETIEPYMVTQGFKLYVPEGLEEKNSYSGYSILQVLFVRNIEFEQKYRKDQDGKDPFPTIYRYLYGKFNFAGEDIYYKTSHAPCGDRPDEAKQKMIKDEMIYQTNDMKRCFAISAGDWNVGCSGDVGYNLFRKLPWEDFLSTPTYFNKQYNFEKQLDYCFVSPSLATNDKIKVMVEVRDDFYKTHTDHRLVVITIKKLG